MDQKLSKQKSTAIDKVISCATCSALLAISDKQFSAAGRCSCCGASFTATTLRVASQDDVVKGKFLVARKLEELEETLQLSSETQATSESSAHGENRATASKQKIDKVERSYAFGRYKLGSRLGQGGFGEVWLARDTKLDRDVALKLPHVAKFNAKSRARFLREARACARLQHPNIVAILDAGEVRGRLYLAADYIQGATLADLYRDRSVPPHLAVEYLIQLADAVAYAHESGIIHRDLKPENIIVDSKGVPQLLDFGLAKQQEAGESDGQQTLDGTVLGTPAYMSPEQAAGNVSAIGPASDQYSLGVLLYRLLSGRTPFQGPPLLVLQKVMTQTPPQLSEVVPGISRDLQAICQKAMAKDPRDRYTSCRAFQEDLIAFQAGLPVSARPLPGYRRVLRWAEGNRLDATMLASCFAASIVLLFATISGWASASVAAFRASQSAEAVREETSRLEVLEQELAKQLQVAQAKKEESQRLRTELLTARTAIDQQTEVLKAAQQEAALALAKVEAYIQDFEKESAQLNQVSEEISATESARDISRANVAQVQQQMSEQDAAIQEIMTHGFPRELAVKVLTGEIPLIRPSEVPAEFKTPKKFELNQELTAIQCLIDERIVQLEPKITYDVVLKGNAVLPINQNESIVEVAVRSSRISSVEYTTPRMTYTIFDSREQQYYTRGADLETMREHRKVELFKWLNPSKDLGIRTPMNWSPTGDFCEFAHIYCHARFVRFENPTAVACMQFGPLRKGGTIDSTPSFSFLHIGRVNDIDIDSSYQFERGQRYEEHLHNLLLIRDNQVQVFESATKSSTLLFAIDYKLAAAERIADKLWIVKLDGPLSSKAHDLLFLLDLEQKSFQEITLPSYPKSRTLLAHDVRDDPRGEVNLRLLHGSVGANEASLTLLDFEHR